jgi:ClpP class serine protease
MEATMPQQLSQFHQRPALIDARHIMDLSHLPSFSAAGIKPEQLALSTGVSTSREYKPYRFEDGVAIIKVQGVLLHNYGWSWKYATGYDVIQRKLHHAWNDLDVKGVLMLFDTPGGSVHGCPDTGDLIAKVARDKPVWGLCEDMALSAGQWLHSQCSRRFVTQSGELGSVGARMMHVDMSKAYEEAGYKVTLLYDGDHKVDGNPFEKLPEKVAASFKQSLKDCRTKFATAVASGTGMEIDQVLETEAQTYTGANSVEIGFAESVKNRLDLTNEFIEHLREQDNTNLAGITMSVNNPEIVDGEETTTKASAQQAERERIKAITACDESEGRKKLAEHLAYDTDLSADQAVKILAAAEKETTTPASVVQTDALSEAMGGEEQPELSADSETHDELEVDDSPEAEAKKMAAVFNKAKGIK